MGKNFQNWLIQDSINTINNPDLSEKQKIITIYNRLLALREELK